MYDYVIVGAGSAGCVLAARLSEDPETSVLLLEAGPPDTNQNIHVPLGYLQLARTEIDWDYSSAPEPNCNGRRVSLPRGRVMRPRNGAASRIISSSRLPCRDRASRRIS